MNAKNLPLIAIYFKYLRDLPAAYKTCYSKFLMNGYHKIAWVVVYVFYPSCLTLVNALFV